MATAQIVLIAFSVAASSLVVAKELESALETTVVANKCAADIGIEINGNPLLKLTVSSIDQCCVQCKFDQRCHLWTYYDANPRDEGPNNCYLFNNSNQIKRIESHEKATSGRPERDRKAPRTNFQLVGGKEYGPKNMYRLPMKSADECLTFCVNDLFCKAMTYNTKTKMCQPKFGDCCKTAENCCVQDNKDAISALVRDF